MNGSGFWHPSGYVYGGSEGTSRPCEDMQTHMWNLERQLQSGGSWADWNGVHKSLDQNTKWWYFEKNNSGGGDAPEWWLKHCGSAFCSDP